MANAFDFLDAAREHPRLHAPNVRAFEFVVYGFCQSLELNGLLDDSPGLNHHFRDWLRLCRQLDHTSAGWGAAIDMAHPEPPVAFDFLFECLTHYRELQPQVIAFIDSPPDIEESGHRFTNYGTAIARPDRIDRLELVRYYPLPLHHVRVWYGTQRDDRSFLSTSDGLYEMGIEDAIRCVQRDLRFDAGRWHYLSNDG